MKSNIFVVALMLSIFVNVVIGDVIEVDVVLGPSCSIVPPETKTCSDNLGVDCDNSTYLSVS
jgi:hypothetical protein